MLLHNSTLTTVLLSLKDSNDNETFTAVPVSCKRTATSVQNTWKKGDVIARLPIPSSCREYVMATFTTDDASVSGSVDVIFDYLPR